MFENFFRKDEVKKTDSGAFVAVPKVGGEEGGAEEDYFTKRVDDTTDLERQIAEIESDPNHADRNILETLKSQLEDRKRRQV